MTDPDDIIQWPCGTRCYRHELAEFNHKSDDYEVLRVGTPAYEAHQEPACRDCGGAGHIEVLVGRGPDTCLEPACCPACEGTGAESYSHGGNKPFPTTPSPPGVGP